MVAGDDGGGGGGGGGSSSGSRGLRTGLPSYIPYNTSSIADIAAAAAAAAVAVATIAVAAATTSLAAPPPFTRAGLSSLVSLISCGSLRTTQPAVTL